MTKEIASATRRKIFRIAMASVFAMTPNPTMPVKSAKADIIQDAWGLVTDPLKLGKASDNILQAVERLQLMLNQLSTLEVQANRDLTDRINQVRDVVNDVISAVDRNVANLKSIVENAEQTMATLEHQIYLDAESILDKAQCVAQNIATVQIQEALANAVADLRAADPSITFFGIRIINLRLKQVVITDPDQAYLSVRNGYLKKLDSLTANSSAYSIISTFANIERLAEEASCAYRDPVLAAIFLKEEFTYRLMALPWSTIDVALQQ